MASEFKCEKSVVTNMKHLYFDQINSVRRFEEISTIRELVAVLKKRNCLNSVCLDFLSNFDENDRFMHERKSISNYSQSCSENSVFGNERCKAAMEKKEMVIRVIGNEIGDHWREFARFLNIQESKIDHLSAEYPNSPQMIVSEILRLLEKMPDSAKWDMKLINALGKCRRNVLRDKVNEILCN